MTQRGKRLLGIILVTIFAHYYANVTLFYHGHVINGVTIVHSHFHGKDHAQNGTHTESEVTLISALSAFQSFAAVLFFAGLVSFLFLSGIFLTAPDRKAASQPLHSYSLRGPPAFA